ncbi:type I methionyl aminopeptidase [Porphyromonas sp.]|uniref:type I methionyl aminopeptidase n=1 Tax=Porphyromonas sp. TaxID=1924944 RepID=UPI0039932213
MIYLKTPEEIELMRVANRLVGETLGEVAKHIAPGVTTKQLDTIAYTFICDHGATPAFLGYGGFPASICTSINDHVVHGIPSDREILREGDIISVDCGTHINGLTGDSAYTFAVGEIDPELERLLTVTRDSLYLGIKQAVEGHYVGHIGAAVQRHCEAQGYGIVRELVGHGIGHEMHEDPNVPNYGHPGFGPKLRAGMCICIEPMVTMGRRKIVFESDGWTVRTHDGKPAAHFEHCIAIMPDGQAPQILSTYEYIKEALGTREF